MGCSIKIAFWSYVFVTEISEITTWLKTTIPGIIILGALGSILALILLKLLALLKRGVTNLFSHIVPLQVARIRKWYADKEAEILYDFGFELGNMTRGSFRGEIAFFAYQISQTIGWSAIFVVLTILAIMIFVQQQTIILTTGAYLLVVFSILTGLQACKHIFAITLAAGFISNILYERQESIDLENESWHDIKSPADSPIASGDDNYKIKPETS